MGVLKVTSPSVEMVARSRSFAAVPEGREMVILVTLVLPLALLDTDPKLGDACAGHGKHTRQANASSTLQAATPQNLQPGNEKEIH